MHREIGQRPERIENEFRSVLVEREILASFGRFRCCGEERRNREPKESGALAVAHYYRLLSEVHELSSSWFFRGFDEHGANGMHAESFDVQLLFYEMTVRSQFRPHVCH